MDDQLISKLSQIWKQARVDSPLSQKSAVCISTIDSAGFPQSRYVDLKEIDGSGFTFCTSYNSEKGKQLSVEPKASLLAWWDHIGYQIRVVGNALRISNVLADKYWRTRSTEAQVASTCFKQSELWDSETSLQDFFSSALSSSQQSISRPNFWGGYTVVPHSIEILKFKTNRVHVREQYFRDDSSWKMRLLQP